MYKIKRYSYSLPVISTAPIWRKLSYGEINHLYIKDVDVFFMNKIEYFQIPFDECERGIKVIFNENDTLEIYDDSTDSYLSWHLTYDEVQGELYVCWTDRIKQKSFTKEAFEFERNLGYHLDMEAKRIL